MSRQLSNLKKPYERIKEAGGEIIFGGDVLNQGRLFCSAYFGNRIKK